MLVLVDDQLIAPKRFCFCRMLKAFPFGFVSFVGKKKDFRGHKPYSDMYVILFVCYVKTLVAMKIPSALRKSLAASSVSFFTVFHSYHQQLSVEAVEAIAVRQEQKIASKTFMEFLASMEKGEISRVVFKGGST
jgi:hypothetical protein